MSAKPSLVIATRNAGKLREIRGLLEPHGVEVLSLADYENVPEVEETGETFAENAALKATQIARHLNCWTLGEDSGLMVDALDGRPGIYSARYSGPEATDEKNNAKLIEELEDVPTEKRGAQYVCSLAVSDPEGTVQLTEEATCRGQIATEPHGENGFGYDPYFTIVELHKTFGELPPVVKQHLSHRARAFERVTPKLVAFLKP
ncbi:MAG: XTP/dITP diphosphatase [Planctomycetaceae bacterium]|nr:XTP/dITP diphosphatase [Planctomycetaceae bacterium]